MKILELIVLVENIKKEAINFAISFAIVFVILKLVFLGENLLFLLRTTISLYWLYVLPGFVIMYFWHDKLDFIERFIIGSVLGLAIVGTIGYNLSAFGFNMQYQIFVLPALVIAAGILLSFKKR